MSATLRLSRVSRVVGIVINFGIVLDGAAAGKIGAGKSVQLQVEAGSHTLQVRYLLPLLTSPERTFHVDDGDTVDFVCRSRPFVLVIPWLLVSLIRPNTWLVLEAASGPAASAR
jgi:hypothetical protein